MQTNGVLFDCICGGFWLYLPHISHNKRNTEWLKINQYMQPIVDDSAQMNDTKSNEWKKTSSEQRQHIHTRAFSSSMHTVSVFFFFRSTIFQLRLCCPIIIRVFHQFSYQPCLISCIYVTNTTAITTILPSIGTREICYHRAHKQDTIEKLPYVSEKSCLHAK